MTFDPKAAARAIAEAHRERATFANLTGDLEPPAIADAYAAQEALRDLWEPERGPVVGLKIATTTKIMQELMGIDHPCGGMIYAKTVHASGVTLDWSRFVHGVVECELAVRLAHDLPAKEAPYTPAEVRAAVGTIMPAFELIEDRNAVYRETDARTLIADNAWNGGIVIGPEIAATPERDLNAIAATVTRTQGDTATGRTDRPMDALAFIANLAAERGRAMSKGIIVITGSVVPTFDVAAGETVTLELDGVGSVAMTAG